MKKKICKMHQIKFIQNVVQTSSTVLYVFLLSVSIWQQPHLVTAGSMTKGFMRMRAAKIGNIHEQPVATPNTTTTTANQAIKLQTTRTRFETFDAKIPIDFTKPSRALEKQTDKQAASKYEIHSVSGEPNYKSVNLTWEVEFVPAVSSDSSSKSKSNDAVTNSSIEVEPPKVFQIFYCELQSFGPHRCRSKLVDERQRVEPAFDNNANIFNHKTLTNFRKVRQYSAVIDNLRMATKYSFHVRPQVRRRNMKITGRSEIFGNAVDDETLVSHTNFGDQTIIVPTKGFTAQATKCLPHASEIEVETGPYFAGKIVVDGGNCGIKGNPDSPVEKYTMRIDHKMCNSLVKPETNTVETFITVQENLGIFTHSTRRFVVICSYQSGMQTVRASFTVPGKDGIAAAVENDPFQPDDDRMGRRLRPMQYVDKSALVLKEHVARSLPDIESEARVLEVKDPSVNTAVDVLEKDDAINAVAILEDIKPGFNEQHIKHESNSQVTTSTNTTTNTLASEKAAQPVLLSRQAAKYAKLVGEHAAPVVDLTHKTDRLNPALSTTVSNTDELLLYFVSNLSTMLLLLAITVIMVACGVFIALREFRRVNQLKHHNHHQNTHHKKPTQHQHQQQTQLAHKRYAQHLKSNYTCSSSVDTSKSFPSSLK